MMHRSGHLRGVLTSSALLVCLTACGGGSGTVYSVGSTGQQQAPSSSGFLYVAAAATNGASGLILQYAIGADGSLAPLNVTSVPAGTDPVAIASDPAGQHVYVVNSADHTISQYSVGAGGGLTPLSPAVVSIPMSPSQGGGFWVSIDPGGHNLYVVTSPPGPTFAPAPALIAQYAIGTGGLLAPLAQASVTLTTLASGPLVIDSIGHHAYLGGGLSGVVLQFSVGSDGTLTSLALAGVAADSPTGVVLAPRGEAAYVLGRCVDTACDGEISLYATQPDGSLNPRLFTTLTGSHMIPVDMAVSGSKSSAYLLTNFMGVDTNSGKLFPFAINSDGTLMPQGEIETGSAAVAEALNGNNLYILTSNASVVSLNSSGGHLARFTLTGSGTPTEIDTTSITGQNPTAMALAIPL